MRLLAVVFGAVAMLLGGCGIPVDDEPVPVALPQDFDLEPTTSTSTTIPDDGASKVIYLVRDGQLVQRRREIAEPITTAKVIESLVAGPTEDEVENGFETLVAADMNIEVSVSGQVLVFNLVGDFTEESPALLVEGELRSLLIGQLVLTGLRSNADLLGVNFRENGEKWLQVINGAGELQELDENEVPIPLTQQDFAELRPGGS